jgi:lipoprotein-anchoring transpeptidase ErfK/SrfK
MSRHRQQQVRPRYGRIGLATASMSVTVVAVLGGVGALPSAAEPVGDGAITPAAGTVQARSGDAAQANPDTSSPDADTPDAGTPDTGTPDTGSADTDSIPGGGALNEASPETVLPADSGDGRRVVFSESRQRVWLVNGRGTVVRTYLVSGSVSDNLEPGTYSVYSRSQRAWGIDDSGTMKYFVRFAHGDNAAIGFHDIPVDEGQPVQSVADLGTPQSHGCIRQKREDAIALWDFASLGSTVVVTE